MKIKVGIDDDLSDDGEGEGIDETCQKLHMIGVKFLRLAHRLGQAADNVIVAEVLNRLAELRRDRSHSGAFSFDCAIAMAEQLEESGQEQPIDFSCTILVLGKTGVGKSATINSLFGEIKSDTDAFKLGTKKVKEFFGTVQGIKVRVIDTPGLLPSWSDQHKNKKVLHSVKGFMKKNPPDIVLYLDRLDMQSRNGDDVPLLQTITEIFGPSVWLDTIVVLTHAASAPTEPDHGPKTNTASSYNMFVTQCSLTVLRAINQVAGNGNYMLLKNPILLAENHPACITNNDQVWKPNLLLLSFASIILAEARTLQDLHGISPPGKLFETPSRKPSLSSLLSSLLQSRPQLKLPEEQFFGDDDDVLGELSDSDDDSEYNELPPFRPLNKAQLEKLTKAQKKAYFDEVEYREQLFMKRQLKEEKKQRQLMKKMAATLKDLPSDSSDNVEEEIGGAPSYVPEPFPDLALPASFDSDDPSHRYHYLDNPNQWLVRPVLETPGWDHDVGVEMINVERLFVVKKEVPLTLSGQVTTKDANFQMEVASSIKHGEGKATSLGLDIQSVGKDMACTLRSETKFINYRHNKAAAGFSVSRVGDALSAGLKLEDKLIVNKQFRVVMSGGAMAAGRGDVAYGGNLEATLTDKDYPLGHWLSSLGLYFMNWHGNLAIGCGIVSQIPVGKQTNMIVHANLSNKGAGKVSVRLNSKQLQIALIGLIPFLRKLLQGIFLN